AHAALAAGEHDLLSVGRPRDVVYGADVVGPELLLDLAARRAQDRDLVVSVLIDDERESLTVRRPVTRRVDEADGVGVAVAAGTRQTAHDLASLCVGEHELDAEQVRLGREERDVLAVVALRRSHVVLAALLEP